MSLESLNDDDIDISELADLVGNFLANATSERKGSRNMPQALDARRAVERYLNEKQLQTQIHDPLFGLTYC